MKLSYGWVVVGAGMLMTCIGVGAMLSLAVFLQPIAAATGWSRSGISAAATLDFLCMGAAAVSMAASLGMALGPWAGGFAFDTYGSYAWLYIGSAAIGFGAVAIALTFRPARLPPAELLALKHI